MQQNSLQKVPLDLLDHIVGKREEDWDPFGCQIVPVLGLAAVTGSVGAVGMAGLTLGGG